MNKQDAHTGSSFDSFLAEEGMLDEAEAVAVKRVIAWQLRHAMKKNRMTKRAMAAHLQTSRSQVDRLLDPHHTRVTLEAITRAARAVGQTLRIRISGASRPKRRTRRPRRTY